CPASPRRASAGRSTPAAASPTRRAAFPPLREWGPARRPRNLGAEPQDRPPRLPRFAKTFVCPCGGSYFRPARKASPFIPSGVASWMKVCRPHSALRFVELAHLSLRFVEQLGSQLGAVGPNIELA